MLTVQRHSLCIVFRVCPGCGEIKDSKTLALCNREARGGRGRRSGVNLYGVIELCRFFVFFSRVPKSLSLHGILPRVRPEQIPPKTYLQCMLHWNHVINPELTKGKGSWKPEEDKRIIEVCAPMGGLGWDQRSPCLLSKMKCARRKRGIMEAPLSCLSCGRAKDSGGPTQLCIFLPGRGSMWEDVTFSPWYSIRRASVRAIIVPCSYMRCARGNSYRVGELFLFPISEILRAKSLPQAESEEIPRKVRDVSRTSSRRNERFFH